MVDGYDNEKEDEGGAAQRAGGDEDEVGDEDDDNPYINKLPDKPNEPASDTA